MFKAAVLLNALRHVSTRKLAYAKESVKANHFRKMKRSKLSRQKYVINFSAAKAINKDDFAIELSDR